MKTAQAIALITVLGMGTAWADSPVQQSAPKAEDKPAQQAQQKPTEKPAPAPTQQAQQEKPQPTTPAPVQQAQQTEKPAPAATPAPVAQQASQSAANQQLSRRQARELRLQRLRAARDWQRLNRQ